MRVTWITFGAPVRGEDGVLTSTIASLRYRVLIPIQAMRHGAWEHRVVAMGQTASDGLRDQAAQTDVMIFSKSFLPANEALAEKARSRGAAVIFDVCDNHYRHPQFGAHYQAMTRLADQVICNTPAMAAVARAYCRAPPLVIEDPYEGARGVPAFAPSETLNLLWFGHPANLDSLQSALSDLVGYSATKAVALTVLTQPSAGLAALSGEINARFAGRFAMTPRPWSLEAQWRALAACDAVVIPSLQNDGKQVKSANRMIEALWAGRPVVAQPMPAYAAFAGWTPVRETLSEGLEWLMSNADRSPALVSQAQDYIESRCAPGMLAGQWERAIETQHARRLAPQ